MVRKLQTEIEKVLKKIDEGVLDFNSLWEKVHDHANTNQREKYEVDLKTEIKKLQRLRDQLKTWLQQKDVKDKQPLSDARQRIEQEMERFKVFERQVKTKAFSKEGLAAVEKMDPQEEEKQKHREWIAQAITSIGHQHEEVEAEIEEICQNKKTLKKRSDELDHLKARQYWHNWHISKLEMLLRKFDNNEVAADLLDEIDAMVTDYIERNNEPEYMHDELFYESVGLVDGDLPEDDEPEEFPVSPTSRAAKVIKEDQPEPSQPPPPLRQKPAKIEEDPPKTTWAAEPSRWPLDVESETPKLAEAPKLPEKPQPPGWEKKSAWGTTKPFAPEKHTLVTSFRASADRQRFDQSESLVLNRLYDGQDPSVCIFEDPDPPKPAKSDSSKRASSGSATPLKKNSSQVWDPEPLKSGAASETWRSNLSRPTNYEPNSHRSPWGDLTYNERFRYLDEQLAHSFKTRPREHDRLIHRKPEPKNQYIHTYKNKPIYPSEPCPQWSDEKFISKLDADCLFFIFHYQQGSYQQYLAARQLRKLNWMYHKKYYVWFRPYGDKAFRTITEEYDQGPYIYLDPSDTWIQRVKNDFRFAFKYLEDIN